MTIKLSRKKLLAFCLGLVGILSILQVISIILYFRYDTAIVEEYVIFFDFGIEENLPTYCSSMLLLMGALAMALSGFTTRGKNKLGWCGLAFVFLMLSIDEITQIHEGVGEFFENFIKSEGILYHVWVVPYIALVAIFGLVYLPFYFRLPKDVRVRFTFAGMLYVGGAIGLEMIGSMEASAHGMDTVIYTILYSVEELFEMLGAVFFIDAAAVQLTRHNGPISVSLLDSSRDEAPVPSAIPQHAPPAQGIPGQQHSGTQQERSSSL